MNKVLFAMVAMGMTALASIQEASAHVGWGNRDLILNAQNVVDNGDGSITYEYRFGSVTGNYGWADGLDYDWGDSHIVRFTKFEITNPGGAVVDISVRAATELTNPATGEVTTALGDLNPAFTLYKGVGPVVDYGGTTGAHNLVPASSFDTTEFLNADELGKEGLFRALHDVTMCNTSGQCGTQAYVAHAGEINDPSNSVSLAGLFLEPGWYSLVIGGNSHIGIPLFGNDFTGSGIDDVDGVRGFHVDLTITPAPVPVPAAVWLMGSALVGLIGMRRREAAV
ncbi:conserved exported protein of unknown function [Methylocaldum szegediense]|jgi:hypothetical protein|uniref:PEP-CTERM protein-sorting domain-containing protein n=2 Tax=Methylocaldum szegediense TaxID=73780 RepID=A0ABM9HWN2_9GAMM|nr:hypothetical protein [Methylocaldum szegediense]CAI8735594.1 conserved exported protein of unknown function [Methylocaldum szegediense]